MFAPCEHSLSVSARTFKPKARRRQTCYATSAPAELGGGIHVSRNRARTQVPLQARKLRVYGSGTCGAFWYIIVIVISIITIHKLYNHRHKCSIYILFGAFWRREIADEVRQRTHWTLEAPGVSLSREKKQDPWDVCDTYVCIYIYIYACIYIYIYIYILRHQPNVYLVQWVPSPPGRQACKSFAIQTHHFPKLLAGTRLGTVELSTRLADLSAPTFSLLGPHRARACRS